MLKRISYLFLIITFSAVSSEAIDLKQYDGQGIIIQYESRLENAAMKLAGDYPKIKTDIEIKLGWKVGFIPTVVLIHQKAEFRKMVRNDLVTAFAVPKKNLIVIDYSKMDRTPFDLQATFKHELCHLLLHQNIKRSNLPKWLNEGVAQWASGGIADIINPYKKDILKQAVISNKLLPLKKIALTFPEHPRGLLLSYGESKSFVEFIAHEYGPEKLLSVLESLKKERVIEQAVYENLSIELNILEQRWQRDLLRKYTWLSYIANHIYWILFFAAALATFIGYLRFRRQMKNYRDEEDEDLLDEGNPDDTQEQIR